MGSTILLLGVAMIVLPGPAFVLIPAGLAILATEFLWARRLLRRVKDRLSRRPAPLTVDGRRPAKLRPPRTRC